MVLPTALLRNLLEACGTPWNARNLLLPEPKTKIPCQNSSHSECSKHNVILEPAYLRRRHAETDAGNASTVCESQNPLPCWVLQLLQNRQPSLPKTFISGTFPSGTPLVFMLWAALGPTQTYFGRAPLASKHPFQRNFQTFLPTLGYRYIDIDMDILICPNTGSLSMLQLHSLVKKGIIKDSTICLSPP